MDRNVQQSFKTKNSSTQTLSWPKTCLFKKQAFTAHVENLNFQLTLQPTDRDCLKITGETGISIQEVEYRNAVLQGINKTTKSTYKKASSAIYF